MPTMGRASLPRPYSNDHHRLAPRRPVRPAGSVGGPSTGVRRRCRVMHEEVRIMTATDPSRGTAVGRERPDLVSKAKAITERELPRDAERTKESQRATVRAAGCCRAGCRQLQAYDPTRRRAPRPGAADDRRRRQRVRRLRHGLRPAVRRAHTPSGAHRRAGPTGGRYVVRHAVRAQRRGGRAAGRAFGLPMWRPTNSGTEATWTPSESPRGRPAGNGSSRSRAATRPSRRGDDLEQAAARPRRPGRSAELDPQARSASPSASSKTSP